MMYDMTIYRIHVCIQIPKLYRKSFAALKRPAMVYNPRLRITFDSYIHSKCI